MHAATCSLSGLLPVVYISAVAQPKSPVQMLLLEWLHSLCEQKMLVRQLCLQVGPGADSKPGRRSRVRPSSSAAAGLQAAQASDLPLAGLTVSGTGQQAAAGEQTSYAASLQAARQEQQQQAAGSTDLPLAGLTVSGAGQQGAAGEQSTGAASADLLQPQPGEACMSLVEGRACSCCLCLQGQQVTGAASRHVPSQLRCMDV